MSQESVTPTALVEANQFDISGPISISYVRSSITGSPLLAYKDAELDLNFSDAEVQQAASLQGEFVTVTLENAIDVFVRTFTLLVPKITLSSGDQVEFEHWGSRRQIARPPTLRPLVLPGSCNLPGTPTPGCRTTHRFVVGDYLANGVSGGFHCAPPDLRIRSVFESAL